MKVIKGDVVDANKISFADMKGEIQSIVSEVDNFISSATTQLSGEAFTKIISSIEKQSSNLKTYASFIQNFDRAIKSATNKMIRYMDTYDELDDSKKFEVYTLIDGLKRTNKGLEWQISQANKNNDTSIDIEALKRRINNNDIQITELDKKYKLLDGLAGEDSAAAGIISSYFFKENSAGAGGSIRIVEKEMM